MLHTNSGDPLALVGGTLGPPVQGELQGASYFASPSRIAELQEQPNFDCCRSEALHDTLID